LQITLAHLSDLHLGPLPRGAVLKHFALKRLIGGASWRFKRQRLHDMDMANALAEDIKSAKPDHVALTGDLVNIAAHAEFEAAAHWLKRFGDPQWISLVPGNHDTYVRVNWEHGLKHFEPYMQGSLAIENPFTSAHNAMGFPYVRFKGSLAMIGLSSAEPQPLHRASGKLGHRQLELLEHLLQNLRLKGCYRAVMIHHPPLPGLSSPRKALHDAKELEALLQRTGAELVIHGHNHRGMVNTLDSATGLIPIVGVPSASVRTKGKHEAASWNLYRIGRKDGKWWTEVTERSLDPEGGSFHTVRQFTLPS
jgi:3',5'-cyclic AMP phosphodiesterase CpdA